jgi:type IV pilus assembly protein PilB
MSVEGLRAAGIAADFQLECYEPGGCARCTGTGYRGRIGVYEVMPLSDEIRELALSRASGDEVKAVARAQGMESMREDGLEKVKQGITSIAEIARVT